MGQAEFWDDNDRAQIIIKQLNETKATYQEFSSLTSLLEEIEVGFELYEASDDKEILSEVQGQVQRLQKQLDDYDTKLLLSGPHDYNDAILEIHPGAGGTESQDWGSMLLRMFQRWAEQNDFTVEMIDYQDGEEAGIKSVTLSIAGPYAYGYLKSEKGIHRLVRISPFDSNSRRHTSFASVEVTPILDESIEVEINSDDLRIDTYRASGAGGQHINKTSSAVRITHIPTGTVTQSQSQRSQHQNRQQAMVLMQAKLYQLEEEKKAEEMAEVKGEQKDIAWGSQIRSYVFHPYSMVKDHRTNYEVGNVQGVMDGDLNDFINAYLKWTIQQADE